MSSHSSDIETDDASRQAGRYANYLEIGHNAFEFIFDFGQMYSGDEQPRFHTRVVSGPAYAKAFSHTLNDAVGEYERYFGTLEEAVAPEAPVQPIADGEESMTEQLQVPSKSATTQAGSTADANMQDLIKQLTESIEKLQQSIAAGEDSLAAQNRQLSSTKEALTASQQALQQEEQLATGYGDALGRFDTSWQSLKEAVEGVSAKLDQTLDEAAVKAITAKVSAYDKEGSRLAESAQTAREAQAKSDEAVTKAKDAYQQASAALEQLSRTVTEQGMSLDKWRSAIEALGQELQSIDPQTKPARAHFAVTEINRFTEMRNALATAEKYRGDLDARWVAVIGAKRDEADAESNAQEATQAAQKVATARQEHADKRQEVLLAAMDELDAQRSQQKQLSQPQAAVRDRSKP
jgi:chromosome segregation ATPase